MSVDFRAALESILTSESELGEAMTIPVLDADAHIIEDPEIWTARVSSKWGDLVPHVAWDAERQEEAWFIGGENVGPAWGNASAGFDKRWPEYPRTKEETFPASYDAAERLKVMDAGGVVAQALYPNIAGFGGERFLSLNEPELMLECVRAYNDFLLEWCSSAPDRFIPIASLPFWDVSQSVAEIERVAEKGMKGLLFSGAPHELGMPFLADRHWDPLWAAAEAARLPVSFHLGSGDIRKSINPERRAVEGPGGTYARCAAELFLGVGQQLNDLLLSGILPRFPELKFVIVESGIGWVPFVLEAADYHFIRGSVREERPWFEELPSEYFRRQCFVTYWFEEQPSWVFEKVGVDNILFETDFPHPTCLWGDEVQEHIERGLGGQPDDVRRKVTWDNAKALYGLDVPLPASA